MLSTLAFLALVGTAGSRCSTSVGSPQGDNLVLPGIESGIAYRGRYELDAFAPPGDPRPAAVIIHGSSGNRYTHIDQLFSLLDREGYAWFSVDYGSVDDVRAAIDYVRCPGRFNITRRMILIGDDTGAEVALKLAGQGGFDGVVVLGAKLDAGFKANLPHGTKLLMIHGTADESSPASRVEEFCKATAGCTYFPVTGAIHDFENWHPDQWYWKEELRAWLRGGRPGLWKNLAYSRPGGRDLLLDAYIPDRTGPGVHAPVPAVIIAHGGGWEAGDKITYVSPIFAPLARGGFAWFSIDYRLTPYVHVPEQIEDICNAVRFVRAHAAWFHVDPNRIALLGESASGHLVAQAASVSSAGCEVQAVVSFYGVYNFERWTHDPQFGGTLKRLFADPSDAELREYSPIFHARPNLPPILLIQGTADELYKGTMEYNERLNQVHARHTLILIDKAPHGMENWEGHPEWMFYKRRMVDWLKATLAGP